MLAVTRGSRKPSTGIFAVTADHLPSPSPVTAGPKATVEWEWVTNLTQSLLQSPGGPGLPSPPLGPGRGAAPQGVRGDTGDGCEGTGGSVGIAGAAWGYRGGDYGCLAAGVGPPPCTHRARAPGGGAAPRPRPPGLARSQRHRRGLHQTRRCRRRCRRCRCRGSSFGSAGPWKGLGGWGGGGGKRAGGEGEAAPPAEHPQDAAGGPAAAEDDLHHGRGEQPGEGDAGRGEMQGLGDEGQGEAGGGRGVWWGCGADGPPEPCPGLQAPCPWLLSPPGPGLPAGALPSCRPKFPPQRFCGVPGLPPAPLPVPLKARRAQRPLRAVRLPAPAG